MASGGGGPICRDASCSLRPVGRLGRRDRRSVSFFCLWFWFWLAGFRRACGRGSFVVFQGLGLAPVRRALPLPFDSIAMSRQFSGEPAVRDILVGDDKEADQDGAHAVPLTLGAASMTGEGPVVGRQPSAVAPHRHEQEHVGPVLSARQVGGVGQIVADVERHEGRRAHAVALSRSAASRQLREKRSMAAKRLGCSTFPAQIRTFAQAMRAW